MSLFEKLPILKSDNSKEKELKEFESLMSKAYESGKPLIALSAMSESEKEKSSKTIEKYPLETKQIIDNWVSKHFEKTYSDEGTQKFYAKQKEQIEKENEILGLTNKRFEPFKQNYDPVCGYKEWQDVPILSSEEINKIFFDGEKNERYSDVFYEIKTLKSSFSKTRNYFCDEANRYIELCRAACEYALLYKTNYQLYTIYLRSNRPDRPLYSSLVIPKFEPFVRLAIIYEARKEFDKALDVCIEAINLGMIEDGTDKKFIGRMERVIKKCEKAGIDISDKNIPNYEKTPFDIKLDEIMQNEYRPFIEELKTISYERKMIIP